MSGSSDCHRGLKAVIARFRAVQEKYPADEMIAQAEAPHPQYGSVDAWVYAFARKVVIEQGPEEASRLADFFVATVQHLSRLPPDAR